MVFAPDVSVILVSWNTRQLLLDCLAALPAAYKGVTADAWVVDNGSQDGSVEAVRQDFPTVNLIANHTNRGFAGANNQAIRASRGRYVLLLNSDTLPRPGSIAQLVRFADAHPSAGMIGAMLLNPDGSFQGSFADLPTLHSELLSAAGIGKRLFFHDYPSPGPRQSRTARTVGYVQGACMLVRRATAEQVGLIDEGYFMYSEEPDWCTRMWRAGWSVWYCPEAQIVHYGGQSTGQIRPAMLRALYRSKVRFLRTYRGEGTALALHSALVVLSHIKWLAGQLHGKGNHPRSSDPRLSWSDLAAGKTK